jgi:hypothetical protein
VSHLVNANKMVGDTPRTDTELEFDPTSVDEVLDWSRQLERELNEANIIIRQQQLLDEENLRLKERIKRLEEALHRIANTDYRGHRSTESQIAFQALTEAKP